MPHELQQQRAGLHAAAAAAHRRVAAGRCVPLGGPLGGSSGAQPWRAAATSSARPAWLLAFTSCRPEGVGAASRMPRSFEQREEEPPLPGSSGGGSEAVLPFSAKAI